MKTLLIVLLIFPSVLFAEDWSFSSNVDDQGFTMNVGKTLPHLSQSRFAAHLFSYNDVSVEKPVEDYSWIDFSSGGLLLDWHPGQTRFRVTVGGFYHESAEEQDTSLNFLHLNESQFNRASIAYGSNAPYLGVGWAGDSTDEGGWGMALDLGVLYQAPDTLSNCTAQVLASNCVSGDSFDGNSRNLSEYEWNPVFTFGLRYRF